VLIVELQPDEMHNCSQTEAQWEMQSLGTVQQNSIQWLSNCKSSL